MTTLPPTNPQISAMNALVRESPGNDEPTPLGSMIYELSQGIGQVLIYDPTQNWLDSPISAQPSAFIRLDPSGGPIVVDLPSAASAEGQTIIKNVTTSANSITINAAGTDTIDGAASKVLSAAWASVSLWSDGTGWHVISEIPAPAAPPVVGDLYNCPAAVVVTDTVYSSAAGPLTVDKAFAGVGYTGEAIGIVVSKPSATTCRVLASGLSGPIFAGLTPDTVYYVSDTVAGGIVAHPGPSAAGTYAQEIGTAVSPTQIQIDIDPTVYYN